MPSTVITFKNVKSKLYHNEIEKTINIFYPTKRDALIAQKDLRNRLLNSLTISFFFLSIYFILSLEY